MSERNFEICLWALVILAIGLCCGEISQNLHRGDAGLTYRPGTFTAPSGFRQDLRSWDNG